MLDILSSSSIFPFIYCENRRSENQNQVHWYTAFIFRKLSVPISSRGGDKNVSKKREFREKQKEKLTGDHTEPIKTTAEPP